MDCDGPLADFDAGAHGAFGMPPEAFERRFGQKRFSSRLASLEDFFGQFPLLPDAMALYEAGTGMEGRSDRPMQFDRASIASNVTASYRDFTR